MSKKQYKLQEKLKYEIKKKSKRNPENSKCKKESNWHENHPKKKIT